MGLDHYEGFERERKFHLILQQAVADCPVIKARTVKRIIAMVAPEFLEGLFEPRPCRRWLRYVGCGCEDPECLHGPSFFKVGQEYESIDFTGATYTIAGCPPEVGRVGAAYFERLS